VPVTAGVATISNPNAAGYGSLRVRATDSNGNALEHTVIRAYKIA
jgi:hypothetical protein